MDISSFSCVTPEVTRLVSFHRTPFPNDRKLSIFNSPAKLAKAGFSRREDNKNDDVTCEACYLTYGNWDGESPYAVHRVLSEYCLFLSTPSPENDVQRDPKVVSARRRLFPADDKTNDSNDDSGYDSRLEESPRQYVSVLSPEASFSFPFTPKVGGTSNLFASRRLKTFPDQGCSMCITWAEEGFVYRADTRDVQCVFCETVFPFDTFEVQQLHAEKSVLCPRVLLKDVGNISCGDEERIRLKYFQQQVKRKERQQLYAVCHPQYEEESVRMGTFENWPPLAAQLEPAVLSEAGFFYLGCADKVKCYSCGVGLYRWQQGSDPWQQHALHMPTCPHLLVKGQHFIQQAAEVQTLTEADIPSDSSSRDGSSLTGQLVTSSPGSLSMDITAITAALHTSRFPTKDILLGQLRAADVNFSHLCQQRQALQHKDTQLQHKDTQLQHKDTQLQHKDTQLQQQSTVIHEKDTQLQQKDTELQQHMNINQQQSQVIQQCNEELQQRDEELQQRDEELQLHREELRTREAELQEKEAELERRRRLMAYQEQQISSLQVQMQALLAERRWAAQQGQVVQAAHNAPAAAADTEVVKCDVRCKVCLLAESNTIFQPCHHVTCCKSCAQRLVDEVCPVCRAPIRDVLPAYIS